MLVMVCHQVNPYTHTLTKINKQNIQYNAKNSIPRDKLKDDAIAQLSDQLMVLSTRLQEVERRQQLT